MLKKVLILSLFVSCAIDANAVGGQNRSVLGAFSNFISTVVNLVSQNSIVEPYGITEEQFKILNAGGYERGYKILKKSLFYAEGAHCDMDITKGYDLSRRLRDICTSMGSCEFFNSFLECGVKEALTIVVPAEISRSGKKETYLPSPKQVDEKREELRQYFRNRAIQEVIGLGYVRQSPFNTMPEFAVYNSSSSSSSSSSTETQESIKKGKEIRALYQEFYARVTSDHRVYFINRTEHWDTLKVLLDNAGINVKNAHKEGLRKQYLRLIDNHEAVFSKEHILLIAYLQFFYGNGRTSSSSFDPFEELKPLDHGNPSLLFTYTDPQGNRKPITAYSIFCDMLDRMDDIYKIADEEQKLKIDALLENLENYFKFFNEAFAQGNLFEVFNN